MHELVGKKYATVSSDGHRLYDIRIEVYQVSENYFDTWLGKAFPYGIHYKVRDDRTDRLAYHVLHLDAFKRRWLDDPRVVEIND